MSKKPTKTSKPRRFTIRWASPDAPMFTRGPFVYVQHKPRPRPVREHDTTRQVADEPRTEHDKCGED